MYPLTCVDGYRIPLREEVYVTEIIPLTSGPATISSDQKLSLFNPANLSAGPLVNLLTRHGNITCAKAFDVGNATVCTAGEDGSVSMWDLRQDPRQAEVARLTGSFMVYCWIIMYCIGTMLRRNIDNRVSVLSLACSSAGFSVVAGTELQDHQASILIWCVTRNLRAMLQ